MFNTTESQKKIAVLKVDLEVGYYCDTKRKIKHHSDAQNITLKSSWQQWYCILSNSLTLMKNITISVHRVFHIGCPHSPEYFV